MKIIVNKALLGEAANLLARVINPKNAMPILGDVLFDVKDNEVTLTARRPLGLGRLPKQEPSHNHLIL